MFNGDPAHVIMDDRVSIGKCHKNISVFHNRCLSNSIFYLSLAVVTLNRNLITYMYLKYLSEMESSQAFVIHFTISIYCIFLGAKVRTEIYNAFENIYPILKGFKKQ